MPLKIFVLGRGLACCSKVLCLNCVCFADLRELLLSGTLLPPFSKPVSQISQHSPSVCVFRSGCVQLSVLHHPTERGISLLLLLLRGGTGSESMSGNVILCSAVFRSQDAAMSFHTAASRNSWPCKKVEKAQGVSGCLHL